MFLLSLCEKFTCVFSIVNIIQFYKEHSACPKMLDVKSTFYLSFLQYHHYIVSISKNQILSVLNLDVPFFTAPCIFKCSCQKYQRRKWQPTPVFLPRESCGWRSLVGCCPWGHTELDTTEVTQHSCMYWRKEWEPTPVFLPGESQGRRSLVGCHLWGHTESDTTEVTQQQQQQPKILSVGNF